MICANLSTPLVGRLLSPLHTSLSLSLSVASLRFLRIHEHVPLDPLDDVLHEEGVEDKLREQKERSEDKVHHHAVHCSPAIRHGDHCVVWSALYYSLHFTDIFLYETIPGTLHTDITSHPNT